MRVIDAEDLHAMRAPETDHAHQLLEQAALIGSIEIDRIDILVFLGRVLCVLDAAIRPMLKPIRMLADPWMVGRALDREIESQLDSKTVGRRVEAIEILQCPDRWIDRGMSSGLTANRPRAAGRVGSAVQHVALALAIGVTDWMDRRQ